MMTNTTDFTIYCIEEYKAAQNLTGKCVIEIFNKYDILEYIQKHYNALHTTGKQYIVEDIKRYIHNRK